MPCLPCTSRGFKTIFSEEKQTFFIRVLEMDDLIGPSGFPRGEGHLERGASIIWA